jgi:hypothetical protein
MSGGVNGTVCNAQQYSQSLPSNPNPSISCLTHGQTIGLAVSDRLIYVVLNSIRFQLTAEASFLSFFSVVVLFILVVVCLPTFLLLFNLTVLNREMSFVIGRSSQTVAGSCCVIPLTYTWSALIRHCCTSLLIWVLCKLSLFVFDLFQALGGIFDVRWAHIGIVALGPYCSAQGIIQQFGELGVALITLVCPSSYCL